MNRKTDKPPMRVGLVSLGCAKNLVDAEIMLGQLLSDGIEVTSDPAQADAVIVNTCSFIDSAQEESVDAILESNAVREANRRGQALVVSGCLSQRFRQELPGLLPEVDVFMGIDQVREVTGLVQQAVRLRARKLGKAAGLNPTTQSRAAKLKGTLADLEAGKPEESGESLRGQGKFGKTKRVLGVPAPPPSPLVTVNSRPTYIPDYQTPRFRLTPKHFAYVKIAEGCNHPCSFCIIPRMRGTHRSRPQPDIVAEARALLAEGVRELNLISQDSTYYGMDLRPRHSRAIASPDRFTAAASALPADAATICTLLRELNDLPGDFWIRLLYTHPAHWTDELIRTIAECPKVARYIDIPLQHIHENMLERMRRETSRQHIEALLTRIRAGIPGIAIRTTFIVGFPGETEASFESLLEFMRAARFERLGIFTYSREEGTRAAGMSGQVPPEVSRQRRDRAMQVQQDIANQVARSFVGRTLKVLVEGARSAGPGGGANEREHGVSREDVGSASPSRIYRLVARGEADAPDIDGRVFVRGDLPRGEFARVRVTGHTVYDLLAEPA